MLLFYNIFSYIFIRLQIKKILLIEMTFDPDDKPSLNFVYYF